jgi:hypothetical protein
MYAHTHTHTHPRTYEGAPRLVASVYWGWWLWLWLRVRSAVCSLPRVRSLLGGLRCRHGRGLAGGGDGAGTSGVRAWLWGDAWRWDRPVVDVVVVVALLFVLLACRGACVSCRLHSMVGVALDVFSFVGGLQLACGSTVWCFCLCDGGCLGALLFAWCTLLLVALCALRRCPSGWL